MLKRLLLAAIFSTTPLAVDARGRSVPVVWVGYQKRHADASAKTLPLELRRTLLRKIWPELLPAFVVVLMLVTVPVVACLMAIGAFVPMSSGALVVVSTATQFVAVVIISRVLMEFAKPINVEVVVNHLPAHGFCPSCAYNLTGVTPDPDACTTCPECGAAWKLPLPPSFSQA